MDYRYQDGKVAVFLKGCDSRAFNILLEDNQLEREKYVLIGIPCPGMKDQEKAKELGINGDIPLAKNARIVNTLILWFMIISWVTKKLQMKRLPQEKPRL